jgi:hypothetical protein
LAFDRSEASKLIQKVAFLEGEVEDVREAWNMAEANFQDLSNEVAWLNR